MNKIIIPVLASVLILGVIVSVSIDDVYAPKPTKIEVGPIKWSAETQEFDLEYLVKFGTANAGSNAGFILLVTLNISDGVNDTKMLVRADQRGVEPHETPLKYLLEIPFNPIEFGFEGLVDVTVNAQILNPAGKPVAIAEPKDFEVLVTRDTTPPGLAIVVPKPGTSVPVGSTIAVAVKGTDLSGIQKIELLKNDEVIQVENFPQLPTEIDFEFALKLFLSDNPVVLQVRAVDAFGNEGFSEPLPLEVIPDEAPLIEICDNGIDDDGDGLIDLADPDCLQDNP